MEILAPDTEQPNWSVFARAQASALHEQVATATMRALRERADVPALVLEHTELNRATVFIEVLRARGVETVVIELDRGDELADWRHFDIVVAMGGPQSTFEEVPDRAACVLDEAARLFARLGALPWFARTIELAASARVELPPYAQDPLDRLAPDELAVVLAARDGASTQEIAARLVIGPRTVEAMIDEAQRSIGADAVDGFAAVSGSAPGRDR